MKKLFVLILALFIVGCAAKQTYKGETLPDSQVATLKMGGIYSGFVISKIDGRWSPDMGYYKQYKFLPGEHSIKIIMNRSQRVEGRDYHGKPITLYFMAEAGHTYETKGSINIEESVWRVRIIDTKSGADVAYSKPEHK